MKIVVTGALGMSLKTAFHKVILLASKITGTKVNCEHIVPPDGISDIEFRNAIIDSSLFTETTGWKPAYDFESGLKAAYQSYLI